MSTFSASESPAGAPDEGPAVGGRRSAQTEAPPAIENRTSPAVPTPPQALIDLQGVSLCFRIYNDRSPHLKQLLLNHIIGKNYARRTAFWLYRNLSLRVDHGDRLGIVGANGAGKSTLLKLLAGIYHPTAGRIRIRGRLVPLIELGGGFNPELSGLENIFLNGAVLGFSHAEMAAKLVRIIEFADIHDFLDMPVKYYSTGMMLRLAFSIATDISPEILLLDEIFSAGDVDFQEKARRRMDDLLTNSHIVVLASHDLGLVGKICTRAVWLDHGQVVLDGPPVEVCAAYRAHRFPPAFQSDATPAM